MRHARYLRDKLSNLKLVMLMRWTVLHCKNNNKYTHACKHKRSGVAKIFKRGEARERGVIISTFFSRVFFFGRTHLELIEKHEKLRRGLGACPPEKLRKFTCCNGYFGAFWILFRQILFEFFDLNSEWFAKYDEFCSHIFDYACLRHKAYSYRRGSKLCRNCILYIENIFENGWWRDLYPWPSSYPLAMSCRNHQKSLAYFSHCGAPLILFRFIQKAELKGGGGMVQCPPRYALA